MKKQIDLQGIDFPDGSAQECETSGFDRRSFLKLAGFTFASVVVAGCERPKIEKAIPYLIKPEEITPGKAYWYASTCGGCTAGCGILVKNRDGRPIKIEGNPEHPLSKGGLCVVGQATVLGLYDSLRLKNPVSGGVESSWDAVDAAILKATREIQEKKGSVRFLTRTVTSPTRRRVIQEFLGTFADGRHIAYDPLSSSAILSAHEQTHRRRILPRYAFNKAEVICSFDADFLGTWISPVEFTAGYRAGRRLDGKPPKSSHHVQFESRLSLTGSKADKRYKVTPASMELVIAHITRRIEARIGQVSMFNNLPSSPIDDRVLNEVADRLWTARGKSLVVCGTNDIRHQIIVNYINHLLGNYGSTVLINSPSYQRDGNDAALESLLSEMEAGKVSALFIHDVNPVYELGIGERFATAIKKVPLVVSFAERIDETAEHAHFVCPDHHFLESWDYAEPVAGIVSVTQPVIPALGKTRAMIESLSVWMNSSKVALDIIQAEWKASICQRKRTEFNFQQFWDKTVHDGFALVGEPTEKTNASFTNVQVAAIVGANLPDSQISLVLYSKVALLDGSHAHNAWLQEVPDPISKISWDNYAALSPSTATRLNIANGDVVRISMDGHSIEVPAIVQPAQSDDVVAIALGYGRKGTDRFSKVGPQWFEGKQSVGPNGLVGVNAARFLQMKDGTISYAGAVVHVEKTHKRHALALQQTYQSIDVPRDLAPENNVRRPLIQQTTLAAYANDPSSGSFPKHKSASLWPEQHKYTGHHWGMVIDLNACTGCSACVVSCQAENNIPVVGKDEVLRNREMHWIRIDRYFMENGNDLDVAYQPMLCHHCDNAPCETVCPVLATVHSEEGLNQQVYNRCVGTRYCANNCPYKIRRFNWFNYAKEDRLENMVLNPDITVRSRGVMEKCSFCIQRIQEARIEAKAQRTTIKDGDILPACAQSCPAKAIVFGDTNDPNSSLSLLIQDARHYQILSELEIRPSVGYMTIVRNRTEEGEMRHG